MKNKFKRMNYAKHISLLTLFVSCITISVKTQNNFDIQQWRGAWGSDGLINTGDLNGDGKTDVFMWKDAIKTWTVNISNGSGFTMQAWPGWGTSAKVYTGFLNNDRKTDVFFWDEMEKVWRVNLSTGAGFEKTIWTGAWGSDGPINVGDLNKDKKTDVFMWRDSDKSWMVNLSTGSGFTMLRWTGAWGSDGPINVADLNGDEMDDVFMWRNSDKSWTVNLSTGSGFTMQRWTGAWGSDGETHIGYLNNDKKADVFMWRDAEGWQVNLSTGTGFINEKWVGACKQNYISKTGDFNGDGKTDVAIWKEETKEWMINYSLGFGFKIETYTGAWGSDGPIFTGYLNDDRKTDIFMWRGSDNTWMMNLSNPLNFSLVLGVPSKLSDCFVGVEKLNVITSDGALTDGHGAGRAVSITVNPLNDKTVWVATPTGGLFKSTNGGNLWNHVDNFPEWGCFDIEICPTDSNTIIVSCIEDTKVNNGGGVWVSKDGGNNWTHPSTSIATLSGGSIARYSGYGISFQPATNNVFVGSDSGFLVSHDLGLTWGFINPQQNGEKNSIYSILALSNGKVLTYGTKGIWICDNFSLNSWYQENTKLAFSWAVPDALAVSPLNDDHIFLTTGESYKIPGTEEKVQSLFYSINGGKNWKVLSTDFEWYSGRKVYVKCVKTPDQSDKIDLFYANMSMVGRKTISWNGFDYDFADTWKPLSFLHSDPNDLAFSNRNKSLLYGANDGGIEISTNYGISSTQLGNYKHNYDAYQIYDVKSVIDTKNPSNNHIYFGTQDNSMYASGDNGSTWPKYGGTEGGNIQGPAIKPNSNYNTINIYPSSMLIRGQLFSDFINPEGNTVNFIPIYYAGLPIYYAKENTFFSFSQEYENNMSYLLISDRPDKPWPFYSKSVIAINHSTINIHPVVAGSSINPSIFIIYAAGWDIGLLKIDNIFNGISDDETVNPISLPSGFNFGKYGFQFVPTIASFGVDPKDPLFIIIPDINNEKIWITDNGGTTWTERTDLKQIVTDNNTLLFKTSDNRGAFELATTQVSCITFDPLNSNNILIGTSESGIIFSNNHGSTWTRIPNSKQVPNITSFAFIGNDQAIASTWGRGLWKIYFDGSKQKPDIRMKVKLKYKTDTIPGNFERAIATYRKTNYPYLYIKSDSSRTRGNVIFGHSETKLHGKNWSKDSSHKLMFFIDDKQIILPKLKRSADGSFIASLPNLSVPKVYVLKAIQVLDGENKNEASISISVTPNDRESLNKESNTDSTIKEKHDLNNNLIADCAKPISFWFSNPYNWPDMNGSEPGNISIGGTNYDEKTGRLIGNYSSPTNQYDVKHAFILLATLKLSQVNPDYTVWNYAISCEKWLAGLRKITPDNIQVKNEKMIPVLKQIENWINANLCK